ncbi:hypothetical protein HJFPF1_00963 [Paramyrothecium foliicola]|nr:hypothetical protein HJFPF1_00963 [Paramyrothecium foliicola]
MTGICESGPRETKPCARRDAVGGKQQKPDSESWASSRWGHPACLQPAEPPQEVSLQGLKRPEMEERSNVAPFQRVRGELTGSICTASGDLEIQAKDACMATP